MAISIKINSSGSWANLIPVVATARIESAKSACEALALASVGDIAFKVIQDGETVAQYHKVPRAGEPYGWYNPSAHLASLLKSADPVQSGTDRTVSGAIGQP